MRRFLLLSLIATSAIAQTQTRRAPTTFGEAARGLTAAQSSAFNDGKTEFAQVETIDDGLGPVFNGRSCAECHSVPALGGGSNRVVTRIGTITNGVFDPLSQFGGSLLQDHAIGPREGSPHQFQPEQPPPLAATIIAHRRTTSLFGLGFVDATPDATFIALAATEAARNDGTAGRVALVQNIAAGMKTVGKFGWKAQVPTLHQFAGDAYLNEEGITNPEFPDENCPRGNCAELQFNPRPGLNDDGSSVRLFTEFMSMLAAPPRATITAAATDGERVFDRIGCGSCHVATLQSGRSDVAALDHRTYHPYSDFLLHDMGVLGDVIVQGDAGAREIRTAPLWGLRVVNRFLHDGRAVTLDDAILQHDGQARAARDRFAQLSAADRASLIAFLRSL
jgi:CxxC motif-containing protein (DUF1111 family)